MSDELFKFDENELLKAELLSGLVAQLNKDLNMHITEAELTESIPLFALKKIVIPHVVEICNNPEVLKNTINRVDITETAMNKFLKNTPVEFRAEKLSELFIKRCLQKVVIRNYYKGL